MIMKKLTPEEALRAFLQQKEVYRLELMEPTVTFISEVLEDYADNLVTFEETPVQPETKPTAHEEAETAEEPKPGRSDATEAQNEPVAKESKGVRADHETIMEMWRQGWTVKQIREVVGCSDQTVRNHIARG